ncbi:hypothetical protein RD792_017957 [Penstemon davidsonii]|uniref:AT-hook motif nuclear-localized protein n=1 Tax=Penstemon davidsonii TaxID=160366 RepID=A0ABR0DWI2_9LAMI|nr:hypothetical protein RD792_017957 [Penstemon davidsonii]
MDQREDMSFPGSGSYYMNLNPNESVTNLQGSSPSMNHLSNATTIHFQSNTGGSNLIGSNLPLDTLSTMSPHGAVSVGGPPSAMMQGEPVRRKRGRPRKYGHSAAVSSALSPSTSTSVPILGGLTQKRRGRPSGTGRKHQLSPLGSFPNPGMGISIYTCSVNYGKEIIYYLGIVCGSLYNAAVGTMAAHVINIAAGEDIKKKILSFIQGQRAIVILSGHGSVSAANIKISSSGGSVTYEGRYDIVNLSGSYINDVEAPHCSTSDLKVTLAGPDGHVIGGIIEGVLIAASPVQVIAGSLIPRTSKPKHKAVENLEPSGDPDHRTNIPPANIQPSQNLNSMGVWTSS